MTEPKPLQQVDRTYVLSGRQKLSYFSGCDYFRLSSHPEVAAAMRDGLRKFGLNVAASRLTTGNHVLYRRLEEALREFFDAEACLVLATGYLTNLVVCQALAGSFSHALLDQKAHPSLADATRFLDCPTLTFKHRDPEDVRRAVERCGAGARLLLLTDGMFSGDGSVAPLRDYLAVLPRDAMLLVDDAHAAGVIGRTGKGSLEYCEVSRQRVIQTLTLSKAFGTYGGVIVCSSRLRQAILDRSKLFIGHTPLPLPLVSAALEAIRLLRGDKTFRTRLQENAAFIHSGIGARNLENGPVLATTEPWSPILPYTPPTRAAASKVSKSLLRARIFPPFINYPGGPPNGYFRFVLSSEHTPRQLRDLVRVLKPSFVKPAKAGL